MARELKARISLDNSAFLAGIAGISRSLSAVGVAVAAAAARAARMLARIGVALAVAMSFGIKKALDFGGQISDMAARTGLAAKDLVILQQAFQDAGLSADLVGRSINKMQRSIFDASNGLKETLRGFQALGVSLNDLRGKSPAEQFERLSRAIAETEDPTIRSAAAMVIFGRAGAELQTLFRNPEAMASAIQRVGKQADILGRVADQFDEVSDSLTGLRTKLRGFFVGVAESLLPQLERLAKFIDNIDLAGVGQRVGTAIGSGINVLVNAFKQGKISELVALSIKIGFGEAINFLVGALRSSLLIIPALVEKLFSGDFWRGLFKQLEGGALKVFVELQTVLLDVMVTGAAVLQMGFERAISVFGKLRNIFRDIGAFFEASLKTAVQNLFAVLPQFMRPAGLQNKSFEENLAEARARREGDRFQPFRFSTFAEALAEQRRNIPKGIAGLNARADAALVEAGERIARVIARIAEDITAITGSITPADIFNTDKWKTELAKLSKELNVAPEVLEKVAKQTTGAVEDIDAVAVGKLRVLSDSLREIGGIIGEAGGRFAGRLGAGIRRLGEPGSGPNYRAIGQAGTGPNYQALGAGVVDHARQTAMNTALTAQRLAVLVANSRPAPQPVPR